MNIRENRGFTMVVILMVLVIIGILFWMNMRPKKASNDTWMKGAGVDTSSYKSMLDSARKVAADASKPEQEVP